MSLSPSLSLSVSGARTPSVHTFEHSTMQASTTQIAAILIFFVASYFQHMYHRVLSSSTIKHTGSGKKQYIFPRGGLFNYVSCPHYTCEIMIYICFNLLLQEKNTCILLIWVISNLSVVAQVNLEWYKRMFPSEMEKKKNWKSCIPFLY